MPADAVALARELDRLVAEPPPTERDCAAALASLRELGWAEPSRTDRLMQIYERVMSAPSA